MTSMRLSYAASIAARRSVGALARLWPSGMLEMSRERIQPSRIVAQIAVEVAGRRLIIPATNAMHLRRFRDLAAGRKEPHTIAWIKQTLRNGDTFLDIGANVGVFSALAAIVAPKARIYAFEPEPQSAAALAEMVAINRLPITVFVAAIGAQSGADLFQINGKVAAGHSDHQLHGSINQCGKEFQPVATIGTAVFTINHLVDIAAIPYPTHVKIDVDGQEDAVIAGASRALRSCRWLAVERLGDRARDCSDILALGFEPSAEFTRGNMIIAQRRGAT